MIIKYKSRIKAKYCNCVFYARRKVPSLPYGLWTLRDKTKIINSKHPKEGRVAIMALGYWGHVGVVEKVRGNKIYIKEANYRRCRKTKRKGKEREYKIVGYYKEK